MKSKMFSRGRKNTSYKEKANLQSFLKITKSIRLDWLDCFTFFIHALLGAFIVPVTFKFGVETLLELAYTLSLDHLEGLIPLFKYLIGLFQYAQWPLFAVAIASYWFRCNVKVYNYSFTQTAGARIRRQIEGSGALICPRCGEPMRIQRFTEKIREQTGEHEEYYTEWVGFGNDKHPVQQKEIVADYSDVEYTRQYAVCQNQYCMYNDKRPSKRDVALYKFAEMPYKIPDTINYAVRTKAKTNIAAGNIRQYAHGISLLGHLAICALSVVICIFGEYSCLQFLNNQDILNTFLINLAITEGAVLICSLIFQLVVHIRFRKTTYNHVDLKNQSRDGATVVLPDGSEFYAKTDRRLQNMIDSMYANDPSHKKSE